MLTKEYINKLKNDQNGSIAHLVEQYKVNKDDLVFKENEIEQQQKASTY